VGGGVGSHHAEPPLSLNAAVVAEMLENDIASTEEDTPLAFHPAA
jgi:hypothetical protein